MKKTVLALCLFCSLAKADTLFGEFNRVPNEIERGFSIGADFGPMFFTNTSANPLDAGRTVTNPGFQIGFNFGYDLSDFLSVISVATISVAQANPSDSVLDGGLNTYHFALGARAEWPMGRLRPFASVTAGVLNTSAKFGVDNKSMFLSFAGSAGVEYYTFLRHYSLFAKLNYFNHFGDIPMDAISISAGLKYTF